ncbi:uncharacterized protein LOC142764809 [Rhipicephalus microplus]|uniref:uncharacterized protein LOC142764809 n=1 Tax=Rhipicephalus microplus TaxID=6941 RepID=UPI003F6CB329
MCTAQNIAVVKDDGAFDMVNPLLKVMLYAFGVDADGEGYARKCLNSGRFLMGSGKLNIPFSYSYCTRAQITPVLRTTAWKLWSTSELKKQHVWCFAAPLREI